MKENPVYCYTETKLLTRQVEEKSARSEVKLVTDWTAGVRMGQEGVVVPPCHLSAIPSSGGIHQGLPSHIKKKGVGLRSPTKRKGGLAGVALLL